METYNNQYNNVVVKDGHPASFRNTDGSLRNIYTDDGSLTEEGKEVMAFRAALSQSNEDNKKRKRKRKQIAWAVSAAVIVFFLLFFHISLVTAYKSTGLPKIYPKASPTFSNTFITPTTVKEILERYNNASIFEQQLIRNEPFVKLLFDKGILYFQEEDEKRQENKSSSDVNLDFIKEMVDNTVKNNEQTEYYTQYLYGESEGEWEVFNVKIIFGKKDIKVVTSEKTNTFIITGNPKYDEDCTTYYVYYSNDADRYIREITRCKDQTIIVHVSESGEYEIFKK